MWIGVSYTSTTKSIISPYVDDSNVTATRRMLTSLGAQEEDLIRLRLPPNGVRERTIPTLPLTPCLYNACISCMHSLCRAYLLSLHAHRSSAAT